MKVVAVGGGESEGGANIADMNNMKKKFHIHKLNCNSANLILSCCDYQQPQQVELNVTVQI